MIRKYLPIIFVAAIVLTNAAYAGRYELIKGKGVEVCDAYAKNLNSFNPSEPMLCERPVNPRLKDFAKPMWEELTLDQVATLNVEIGDQYLSGVSPRTTKGLNDSKLERIRKAKAILSTSFNDSWPLTAWRAQFDLDNDGKPDPFKKEIQGKCAMPRFPTVLLQPLGDYSAQVRFGKILNSAQHGPEKEVPFELTPGDVRSITTRPQRGTYMFPDVFRHKGEWYLDMLTTGSSSSRLEKLYVFEHRGGTTREICEFQIKNDNS